MSFRMRLPQTVQYADDSDISTDSDDPIISTLDTIDTIKRIKQQSETVILNSEYSDREEINEDFDQVNILPSVSCQCRDGRDGKDGKDGERGLSQRTLCWFGKVNLSSVDEVIFTCPYDGTSDTLSKIMVVFHGQGNVVLTVTDLRTEKIICKIDRKLTGEYSVISLSEFSDLGTELTCLKVSANTDEVATLHSVVLSI